MSQGGIPRSVSALLLALTLLPGLASGADMLFESSHVHPLEISGSQLFVVNTDDHRLAIMDISSQTPVLVTEIPVGLEPVTVRLRTATELWVVNSVSDDISIIDLTTNNVKRTLLVGDEPTDVVFAGAPQKAFVSVSGEDVVRVYDAANPGAPLADIPILGHEPRTLEVGQLGNKIYLGVRDSGSNTTVIAGDLVAADSLGIPDPDPPMDDSLAAPPDVALIVKHNGTNWVDEADRVWDHQVPYTLYDNDVFEIDVNSLVVSRTFTGVTTNIFSLTVSPASGVVYVSGQDARNHIRFEPKLKGHFIENTISEVLGPLTVQTEHLNAHINYANPAGTPGERALSLSKPMGMDITADGKDLYVAAFSSDKVALVDVLVDFGLVTRRIDVGVGPTAVKLDEANNRIYCLNKIDGTISEIQLSSGTELTAVSFGFNPTASNIQQGRAIFYDSEFSSAHGDMDCASCHLFTGMDGLAWDLGDPTGTFQPPVPGNPGQAGFHPMKGPLVTQTLKGLNFTQPFHWRGDRADLAAFNAAFPALLGRDTEIAGGEMDLMEDFLFEVRHLPNPFRNLDGSFPNPGAGPNPFNGNTLFQSGGLFGGANCTGCHFGTSGQNGVIIPGSFFGQTQDLVVPQLRNVYKKTGYTKSPGQSVRGFGFAHDGTLESPFEFFQNPAFSFANDDDRLDVEAYIFAFGANPHASVGAQWTMDGTNEVEGTPRMNTLLARANANNIGLLAKGRDGLGDHRGWVYQGAGNWKPDRAADPTVTTANLYALAGPGTEITFTAVIKGCETRLGVDRDEDGYWDRDEIDAGSLPDNPASTPANVAVNENSMSPTRLLGPPVPNPAGATGARVGFNLPALGAVRLNVFDVQGRRVRALLDDPGRAAGAHEVRWDLRNDTGQRVPAGLYFIQLVTPAATEGRRLMVLR